MAVPVPSFFVAGDSAPEALNVVTLKGFNKGGRRFRVQKNTGEQNDGFILARNVNGFPHTLDFDA
ncbi:hypothetical protein [Corynebacterium mayonis]|uniref:hypothetical protein n=1 Tax=Corynebacterium mayonis TaxID=3062461 RepID=UPI00313FEF1E